MKIRIVAVGVLPKNENYAHANQPCRIGVLQVRKIAGNLEVDWIRQFRNHVTFKFGYRNLRAVYEEHPYS